jgi:TRAP-type C4-dicarboxylate transport system permease small subunit
MFTTLLDRYCRWLGFAMVACLAVMVVLVFGNVVMRYGFNSGFTLSEELSRWLFVWMTFLGAVVAVHERAHLGTDTLVSRLPVAGKKLCLGATYLLMLYLCWLLLRGAWQQTLINADATSAVMQVSMGILYASGVVFAVSAMVMLAGSLWRLLSGRMSEAELIGVHGDEA